VRFIELGVHERAVIGPAIVELVEITAHQGGQKARIGFDAPREVRVSRSRRPFDWRKWKQRRKDKKK
jgi:hypothetical protein